MARKVTNSSTELTENNKKRPAAYTPQQGSKAVLSLADFENNQLFAELRRRGYTGELRFSKVINV